MNIHENQMENGNILMLEETNVLNPAIGMLKQKQKKH